MQTQKLAGEPTLVGSDANDEESSFVSEEFCIEYRDDELSHSSNGSEEVNLSAEGASVPLAATFITKMFDDMVYLDGLFKSVVLYGDSKVQAVFARSVTAMFLGARKGPFISRYAIETEVNLTKHLGQLFREDSLSIMMLRHYVLWSCGKYLHALVMKKRVFTLSPENAALSMLKVIAKSRPPLALREVLKKIVSCVDVAFGKNTGSSMAIQFFFLHILNPCVADPFKSGITHKVTTADRMLSGAKMAKAIQAMVAKQPVTEEIQSASMVLLNAAKVTRPDPVISLSAHIVGLERQKLKRIIEAHDAFLVDYLSCKGTARDEMVQKHFEANKNRVYTLVDERWLKTSSVVHVPEQFSFIMHTAESVVEKYVIHTEAMHGTLSLFENHAFLIPRSSLSSSARESWSELKTTDGADYLRCMELLFRKNAERDCESFHLNSGGALTPLQLALGVLPWCAHQGWGNFEVVEDGTEIAFQAISSMVVSVRSASGCCAPFLGAYICGWIGCALHEIDFVEVSCTTECCKLIFAPNDQITDLLVKYKTRSSKYIIIKTEEEPIKRQILLNTSAEILHPQSHLYGKAVPKLQSQSLSEPSPNSGSWMFNADPVRGTLKVQGVPCILLFSIQNSLEELGSPMFSDAFRFLLGFNCGVDINRELTRGCGNQSVLAMALVPKFFATFGLGSLTINDASVFEPLQSFCGIFSISNSIEVRKYGHSKSSCYFAAGCISGWCSAVAGRKMFCIEVECATLGDGKDCVFLCSPKQQLTAAVRLYLSSTKSEMTIDSINYGTLASSVQWTLPEEPVVEPHPSPRMKKSGSRSLLNQMSLDRSSFAEFLLSPRRRKELAESNSSKSSEEPVAPMRPKRLTVTKRFEEKLAVNVNYVMSPGKEQSKD